MTKSVKSKVIIIILNSILLAVFILTTFGYGYISQYAADGGDPLGFIFLYIVSFPALILLGIILLVFKKRLQIPLINALIAFIGVVAFYIPLIINGTTPIGQNMTVYNYWTRVGLIGVVMGIALIITPVVITLAILLQKRKENRDLQPK